jgi:hypothetical protein
MSKCVLFIVVLLLVVSFAHASRPTAKASAVKVIRILRYGSAPARSAKALQLAQYHLLCMLAYMPSRAHRCLVEQQFRSAGSALLSPCGWARQGSSS